jgi:hypothetical protein
MQANIVHKLANKFADNVDYRTRLLRPETWLEWFIHEAYCRDNPEKPAYMDYLVFCEITERFLHCQKLMDIEKAFIIGVETGMVYFEEEN